LGIWPGNVSVTGFDEALEPDAFIALTANVYDPGGTPLNARLLVTQTTGGERFGAETGLRPSFGLAVEANSGNDWR
jgi:hypothetical protein